MRQTVVVLALLLVVSLVVAQAPSVVKNSEFVDRAAGNQNWPAVWTAADADLKAYAAVNDDGAADNHSLHFALRQPATVGAVTQPVTLARNTDYVLIAALKSDGTLMPVARLAGPDGQLAMVVSDGTKTWKSFSVRFNSGNVAAAQVELFGDATAAAKQETPAGTSASDGIQIYPANQVPATVQVAPSFTPPGPNVALGKKYTLQPAPSYGYSTDPEDAVQLTDGVYTVGYFWTQKTTVGWSGANPVVISLDLGQVEPIAGFSYSTAAGVAGVAWPTGILVLVSDDGVKWGDAGDLITLATKNGPPPPTPYSTFRFATDELKTHGRYVKLFVDQAPYTFVDEIEVYQGPQEYLQLAYTGAVRDPMEMFEARRVHGAMLWRLRVDLAAAREAIQASNLAATDKQDMLQQADLLGQAVERLPEVLPPGFKTILPLNDLHARIYALYAPLHRAKGLGFLTAWQNNRWDMLQPTQAPERKPANPPALAVSLMQREYRATTFNLTNGNAMPTELSLQVRGLPGGTNPAYLSVRDVLFTDTRDRLPIAAALPLANEAAGSYRLNVPSGMTKQVWLEFRPLDVAPGNYRGQVIVTGSRSFGEITMPITLHVSALSFPSMPSIHIGGWDYTQGKGQYEATEGNIPALIQALTASYVDTPWASSAVQPAGATFDPEGKITKQPTFEAWDEWTSKWPGARLYAVFVAVNDTFAGEPMGTPRFKVMVGEWINAWVQHLQEQKLEPEQLVLLLYDEPNEQKGTDVIVNWTQAVNAAQPRVTIFEDPTYSDPTEFADSPMWAQVDVICPNLPMWLGSPQSFRDFYLAQQKAGKELWYYSCSGPSKLLDPITYHRSQFWHAARYGFTGSFYWAFGDEAGASSWNAYLQKRAQFSPLFLDADTVTDAKHMAGIREGAQDYEYFVMLRARVADLEKIGNKSPLIAPAKRLLTEGPERATRDITGANIVWTEDKDRGVMDEVRLEVLNMLEKLAKL